MFRWLMLTGCGRAAGGEVKTGGEGWRRPRRRCRAVTVRAVGYVLSGPASKVTGPSAAGPWLLGPAVSAGAAAGAVASATMTPLTAAATGQASRARARSGQCCAVIARSFRFRKISRTPAGGSHRPARVQEAVRNLVKPGHGWPPAKVRRRWVPVTDHR